MEARKIIITGGATRMGAAIARKLSGPNIEILIHYNKSKLKAEKLKKEVLLKQKEMFQRKKSKKKEIRNGSTENNYYRWSNKNWCCDCKKII